MNAAATRSDPRAVVLACWESLRRCDFKGMEQNLGDAIVWQLMGCEFLPTQGMYVGKETVVRDLLGLAATLYTPDTFRLDVLAVYADGPHVIVEFLVNCINHLGREYKDVTYCNVFRVEGGKIVEVREYMDSYKVKTIHVDA